MPGNPWPVSGMLKNHKGQSQKYPKMAKKIFLNFFFKYLPTYTYNFSKIVGKMGNTYIGFFEIISARSPLIDAKK